MLYHLLVLLFNRHSMQSICAVFHFKWYVLLLYLTYHLFMFHFNVLIASWFYHVWVGEL